MFSSTTNLVAAYTRFCSCWSIGDTSQVCCETVNDAKSIIVHIRGTQWSINAFMCMQLKSRYQSVHNVVQKISLITMYQPYYRIIIIAIYIIASLGAHCSPCAACIHTPAEHMGVLGAFQSMLADWWGLCNSPLSWAMPAVWSETIHMSAIKDVKMHLTNTAASKPDSIHNSSLLMTDWQERNKLKLVWYVCILMGWELLGVIYLIILMLNPLMHIKPFPTKHIWSSSHHY